MTNPKLYYDDPLAAAYMAREFGIRFSGAGVYPEILSRPFLFLNKMLFIHPDSHHIFETKQGDLGYVHGKIGNFGNTMFHVHNSQIFYRRDKYDFGEYEIIQRNGKAFFMPEREE